MGPSCWKLLFFAVAIFALTLETFVNGFRAHSWFRNPEDYEFQDDYDFRATSGPHSTRGAVELIQCPGGKYDPPAACVPLERCPQLGAHAKRHYCRIDPNRSNRDPCISPGPYVCCPNIRPGPQSKVPNTSITASTSSNKEVQNTENNTPKPSTQTINQVTVLPETDLIQRSNINPAANTKDCGILEKDEKDRLTTRIIGSFDNQKVLGAAIGGISLQSSAESPWTVALGEYSRDGSIDWFCGGSLLSPSTVLTAAHCARRRRPNVIRAGEVDLRRNTRLKEGRGEDVGVKDIIMHPDYRPPSYYHDIAILILERPVDISKPGGARTICLPPPRSPSNNDLYTGKEAILTGWGHLSFGGDRSPVLQEVRVTVFSNEDCSKSYSVPGAATVTKRSYPAGIVDSQLCAGDRQGKKDACQGDSGGPLVVKGKDGKYSVIGVVSSGIGCGSRQYPGVYVRVSSYVDWINSKMKL